MIARVGNDPCPLRLRNEWLSPCAASTLPSVGLEICASCATRGTCIRTHLFPTPCREAAITGFGDHANASITRCPPEPSSTARIKVFASFKFCLCFLQRQRLKGPGRSAPTTMEAANVDMHYGYRIVSHLHL